MCCRSPSHIHSFSFLMHTYSIINNLWDEKKSYKDKIMKTLICYIRSGIIRIQSSTQEGLTKWLPFSNTLLQMHIPLFSFFSLLTDDTKLKSIYFSVKRTWYSLVVIVLGHNLTADICGSITRATFEDLTLRCNELQCANLYFHSWCQNKKSLIHSTIF